jgi:hypothetical protein
MKSKKELTVAQRLHKIARDLKKKDKAYRARLNKQQKGGR